ncbi:hypothetical protein CROQUDRAFT_670187 [Cronartium quercuum f. sp. fusiforme G11]|uniref:Bud22 domain-containing protein n=1 Tax=Cronartium quercuum f. sp. fusiforme G11 TaxID=708437 RepID=A0A9P6TDU2_9BASI|nr:hypothetical protein CROQUDRAFT_670187 [Cronartium quercuum f. sp. fusiforme G11]
MNRLHFKRQKLDEEIDLQTTYALNKAIRQVSRAVKKAKTFELQHLVRKIKRIRDGKALGVNSKLDSNQIPLLEADLEEIKAIDASTFARQILTLRVAKLSPPIPLHLPPSEALSGRVANKLSSNKQLTKTIAGEIDRLRTTLVDPSKSLVGLSGGRPVGTHISESEDNLSDHEDAADERVKHQRMSNRQVAREHEAESDDDESSSEEEIQKPLRPPQSPKSNKIKLSSQLSKGKSREQPETVIVSSDLARPEDCEVESSEGEEGQVWDVPPSGRRPSTSTFLPSLNVGYVCGDSDASSVEDPVYDRLEREMGRKNRRGQRARRAIWEKKFGKGAKHLQKVAAKRRPVPTPPTVPLSKPGVPLNPNLAPMGERKAVHPSWEAKVKQQEALAKTVPMGKKIVFD